jgi:hypothetical protein
MKRSISAAFLLLACLCQPPALAGDKKDPQKSLTFDQYKQSVNAINFKDHTISFDDFKAARTKKNTYVLDLRSKEEYESGHIKGALQMGPDVTSERLAKLVPDKKATLILYCNNTLMPATRMIALTHLALPQFISLGYPKTFVLESLFSSPKNGSWDQMQSSYQNFMKSPLWEVPPEKKH